jgi:hypothetical protein
VLSANMGVHVVTRGIKSLSRKKPAAQCVCDRNGRRPSKKGNNRFVFQSKKNWPCSGLGAHLPSSGSSSVDFLKTIQQ